MSRKKVRFWPVYSQRKHFRNDFNRFPTAFGLILQLDDFFGFIQTTGFPPGRRGRVESGMVAQNPVPYQQSYPQPGVMSRLPRLSRHEGL